MHLSPIRVMLAEMGAINSERVVEFASGTRDAAIPVWHDPATGVIFIDDFYVGEAEYELGEYRNEGGGEAAEELADTRRRVESFAPLFAGRSLIDFGCGSGSFLRASIGIATSVEGVELQSSFREGLIREGIPCHRSVEDCSPADIAFMFHVLEHLPDPIEQLVRLRRKVSGAGGPVVVEVPHARDFLIAHARSQAFIESTLWSQHLVLHTRTSLELLLRKAGFTEIVIIGVQRYGLANHMGWLIDHAGGGHKGPLSLIETADLRQSYASALGRLDATDTLVAIAR